MPFHPQPTNPIYLVQVASAYKVWTGEARRSGVFQTGFVGGAIRPLAGGPLEGGIWTPRDGGSNDAARIQSFALLNNIPEDTISSPS